MGLFTRTQHMGLAACIMGASILLSRIMGLVRDKVISWQFGTTGEADLYFAAFVVPDFINYLLAGGYVSITLMPLLAKRFEEDTPDAWHFFSTVFWWALLAVSALTLVAWLAALPLARLTAPGFTEDQIIRLSHFLRIILPAQIFFLSGACFSALLFLRRQFFIPALTPLIYNGAIILGGLLLPFTGMEGFCWGVSVGAALGAWLLPWWAAQRGDMHILPPWVAWRHPLMGRFLCIALPLMLGQSVVMLNEQFLRIFGSLVGDGAVSLLSYARRISQVPVGMVAQAAAVASYPFLSALAAKGDDDALASTVRTALHGSLILIFPCSFWMIAVATPTMGLIFQGGQFSTADTLASAPLLQIMLLCVPLWTVQTILGRGFYAYGDTLTPALMGTVITICSLPLFYMALPLGAQGVALVAGLGVMAYVILIMFIWQRRRGAAAFAGLGRVCWQSGGLSIVAALCAFATSEYIFMLSVDMPMVWRGLLALVCSGVVFLLCYVLLAVRMAPHIVRPIQERLTARWRRI